MLKKCQIIITSFFLTFPSIALARPDMSDVYGDYGRRGGSSFGSNLFLAIIIIGLLVSWWDKGNLLKNLKFTVMFIGGTILGLCIFVGVFEALMPSMGRFPAAILTAIPFYLLGNWIEKKHTGR